MKNSVLTIDEQLPIGLNLKYLRLLAGIHDSWQIEVIDALLPPDKASSLAASCHVAVITLSSLYLFPPRTLARAIMHELLELALLPLWEVDVHLLSKLPYVDQDLWSRRVRACRDSVIDARLDTMSYWKPYDIPIPKEAIGARNI